MFESFWCRLALLQESRVRRAWNIITPAQKHELVPPEQSSGLGIAHVQDVIEQSDVFSSAVDTR